MGQPEPRALCVSRDRAVRRAVDDALGRLGRGVVHADAIGVVEDRPPLIIVDGAARRAEPDAVRALAAPVIIVADDLADDGLLGLLRGGAAAHVVADAADPLLAPTARCLLDGARLGLEAYLAAGTAVRVRAIDGAPARRHAVAEIAAFAAGAGLRPPVVARVATAVDELLMNALHDAPRLARGTGAHPPGARGPGAPAPPEVRWACDDAHLAVAVIDGHGTLRRDLVLDSLARARRTHGRPRAADGSGGGAGLGLHLVLAGASALALDVEPGRRTEALCLFERVGRGRPAAGPRALHLRVG